MWDALVAAGARPCGMEALEGRRVEVGVPRIGLDMGEKTLALEVPVEDAISSTKGCYLGQEVVARGTARGHVNRRLVAARCSQGRAARPARRWCATARRSGTSPRWRAPSAPARSAALGFVRREHWEPGTELAVRGGHARHRGARRDWPLA